MVELDPNGAAGVVDRQRLIQPAVREPEVIEQVQRLAREPAELGMVALGLELGDDDDRKDNLVLGEPGHGRRVGQQDAGVEDECAG